MKMITAAFALACGTLASGDIVPFQIFENQPGIDPSATDLSVTAFDGGSFIDLVFANNGTDGVVTTIVIENTPASSLLGDLTFRPGLGDRWADSGGSGKVPGSLATHGDAWNGTLAYLTANPSRIRNGIDLGESLTVRLDRGAASFDAVERAIGSGDLRFVAHIQALGDGDESSIWGVTVPAPASAAGLGIVGLSQARRRRRG